MNVIENHDTNPENFLNMIQSHKNHQIWFTSFMGFFYKHGIDCDINRNMALKLYSLKAPSLEERFTGDLLRRRQLSEQLNEIEVGILPFRCSQMDLSFPSPNVKKFFNAHPPIKINNYAE